MSVEALEPEIAERYGELAVFPEDVAIPAATIERLWAFTGGVSAVRSRALLANLSRKSLLSLAQAHNRGTVGFHDLHQDFLKLNADDLPGLHARLLDAYRPRAAPGPTFRPTSPTSGPGSATISPRRSGRKS